MIPLFEPNWDEEEEREVVDVLRSKWLSMGPKTEEYERRLKEFYSVEFALSFNNGTSALLAAYACSGLMGEVIVPSLTFVATVNALVFLGLKPVFADIYSFEIPLLSLETIEGLIGPRTSGVVFVNYAGYSKFLDEVARMCQEKGLILVEDSSHAHGVKYKEKFVGTWGLIGAFSTFSNKNLSTGEGGYILTNEEDVYRKARLFRSHGITSSSWERFGSLNVYDVVHLGLNLRPSEIQSAIGLANLKKLKEENEKRRELVRLYRKFISEEIPDVLIPFMSEPVEDSAHYIFPIILPKSINRKKLMLKMLENGVSTSIHYPAIHMFEVYKDLGFVLPKTEEYSSRVLTLPLWGNMGEDKVYKVVEVLKTCLYSQ